MGLDIYVADEWVLGTPYSGFNEWRDYLAWVAGYVEPDDKVVMRRNGYGYWRKLPEDPLSILMIHHDDCGYIFPEQADALHRRIKGLLPDISTKWKARTNLFLKGLRHCVKTGEPMEFT